MAAIQTEVGKVDRVCTTACKKNMPKESCACTDKTKAVTKVEIFAVFDGVRRYRAFFSPHRNKPTTWPKISNKEMFDERGENVVEVNVTIPDNIYRAMARRALGIMNSSAPFRQF